MLFCSYCGENRLLGRDSLFGMSKGVFRNIKGIEISGSVFRCSFLLTPLAGSRQSSAPPSPAPLPRPSLSNSKPGGPYLCLDHAGSLVSQVLQGSGNINLFSTCNRARIGAGSKQQRNPAHICQSLFMPGSLWSGAPIENYYIHPWKDLDQSQGPIKRAGGCLETVRMFRN